MIIIEGPDGTGKTTLAESIRVATKLGKQVIVHCGPPPKTDSEMVSGAWMQYLEMMTSEKVPMNAIMDRFIYGERVYGPILRQDVRFGRTHQRMLERLLFNRRAVVIFCRTKYIEAKQRWAERAKIGRELFDNDEQYRQIWDRFDTITSQTELPRTVWDPFRWTVETLLGEIALLRAPVNMGPGHGMFQSTSTLFVGDFASSRSWPQDWPAIAYDGHYERFAQQLLDADIPERDLYWVNSAKMSPHGMISQSPSFLSALRPKKIVAFGTAGKNWCQEFGIEDAQFVPSILGWFASHPLSIHPAIASWR